MKISKLIERLEEIKAKEGDIQVSVQYRDDGGSYSGEEELMLEVRDNEHFGIQSIVEDENNMLDYHVEYFDGKRVVL